MTNADIIILSFGYLHQPAPVADLIIDLREYIRGPHIDPVLRELTGLDELVRDKVLNTNGTTAVIAGISTLADAFAQARRYEDRTVTVAIGCAGGRHRSVVVASEVVCRLKVWGGRTSVHHRDFVRPAVEDNSSLRKL